MLKIYEMVAKQADDEGLWFSAKTAPEAYLQQELRKLHAAIDSEKERWLRTLPVNREESGDFIKDENGIITPIMEAK